MKAVVRTLLTVLLCVLLMAAVIALGVIFGGATPG